MTGSKWVAIFPLAKFQLDFYTVLNSRPFALKPATTPLHHGGCQVRIVKLLVLNVIPAIFGYSPLLLMKLSICNLYLQLDSTFSYPDLD